MLELNQKVIVKKREYTIIKISDNSNRPNLLTMLEKSGIVQTVLLEGKRGALKSAYVRKNGEIQII